MPDLTGEMKPFDPSKNARRSGMPTWVLALVCVIGVIVLLVLAGVIWFGIALTKSPETFVYSGNQIPSAYVESARDLGLINQNEQVLFFYSDAMFDVENAMYLLTDQHLALHNKDWADPHRAIAFHEITDISASWSTEWLIDSMITVELDDGTFWAFPLSMEHGTDHRFIETLSQSAGVETPP